MWPYHANHQIPVSLFTVGAWIKIHFLITNFVARCANKSLCLKMTRTMMIQGIVRCRGQTLVRTPKSISYWWANYCGKILWTFVESFSLYSIVNVVRKGGIKKLLKNQYWVIWRLCKNMLKLVYNWVPNLNIVCYSYKFESTWGQVNNY